MYLYGGVYPLKSRILTKRNEVFWQSENVLASPSCTALLGALLKKNQFNPNSGKTNRTNLEVPDWQGQKTQDAGFYDYCTIMISAHLLLKNYVGGVNSKLHYFIWGYNNHDGLNPRCPSPTTRCKLRKWPQATVCRERQSPIHRLRTISGTLRQGWTTGSTSSSLVLTHWSPGHLNSAPVSFYLSILYIMWVQKLGNLSLSLVPSSRTVGKCSHQNVASNFCAKLCFEKRQLDVSTEIYSSMRGHFILRIGMKNPKHNIIYSLSLAEGHTFFC